MVLCKNLTSVLSSSNSSCFGTQKKKIYTWNLWNVIQRYHSTTCACIWMPMSTFFNEQVTEEWLTVSSMQVFCFPCSEGFKTGLSTTTFHESLISITQELFILWWWGSVQVYTTELCSHANGNALVLKCLLAEQQKNDLFLMPWWSMLSKSQVLSVHVV